MNVVATGMPLLREKARTPLTARPRTAPLPARAIGCSASRMSSAARAMSADDASGCADVLRARGPPRASAAITSSGSSMCVDPGFSASATLKALRTTSGMIAGSPTRAFHFVMGRMISRTSMYWCDSLCIRSRSPCPVSTTTGARSRNASATPVMRLVAPGPSVAKQTPARPVRRPYASAMNAAACS